jgi:beta-exotoxin I transport system permease protein
VGAEVARLDLGSRRRAVLGYSAGMGLYALVIVALYPQFQHSTSLDALTKNAPTLSALFGVIGSLTSPAGWLNANLYENFLPLIMLLLTIGYGASSIAGRDEDGTLALVVALPLPRGRILLQKVGAMAVQAVALSATVGAVVVVGRSFKLPLPIAHVAEVSGAVALLGIALGLVTLAIGTATGSRSVALGAGSTIAAISYLISSLAPVVAWMRPARYASLFYWSVGNGQVANGTTLGQIGVLVGACLVAGLAAAYGFARLDLH